MRQNEVSYEEYQKEFDNLPHNLQLSSLNPKFCKEFKVYNNDIEIIYWVYKENENIFMNCFYIGKIKNTDYFDIQSPYPFGGPISSSNDELFLKKANKQFEIWALSKNILVELFKFNPVLDQTKWYNGTLEINRKTIIVNLKNDLNKNYEKRRFYDVRNIEKKNVLKIVKNPFDKDKFIKIYKDNMKNLKAEKFYFFSDEYLKNIINLDITDTWFAYMDNHIVSTALILNSKNSKIIEYFLGARNFIYDKYKSTVYLLHKISEYYKKKNYNKFYLGGGRSSREDDSLFFFKKGFSDSTSNFYIAHKIYNDKNYNDLRNKTNSSSKERILFYR